MVSGNKDSSERQENSGVSPSIFLSCHELSCIRSHKKLFDGLGFCLLPGSLLLVKGANGSGKTSLLKMIAGLLIPAHGNISWNQNSIQNTDFFTYIGHKNAVKPELSVEENLRFWAKAEDAEELLPVALHYFGLTARKDTPCAMLSAGWQRKVALSRLILTRKPVWLLDEPTNFLDVDAVARFTSLVETRVEQGGIVVIATHTIHSAIATHTLEIGDFAVC